MRTSQVVVALSIGLFMAANAAALPPFCPGVGTQPSATFMCRNDPYGKILNAPKVFIDYWGWPQGCSVAGCLSDTAGVIPILEQSAKTFAADTGFLGGPWGTRWLNTHTQYDGYIWPGTNFGHITNFLDMQPATSWFSPNAFATPPPPGATQGQILAWNAARDTERNAAINYFAGIGYNVGADAIIVLAFPPGSTGLAGACGSHAASPNVANPAIHINYNPQLQCAAAVPGISNTVVGVSTVFYHEVIETLTNPHGGGWVGNNGTSSNETGDLCQNFLGIGGIAAGVQPSTKSVPTQAIVAGISDAAGTTGSCVFARATQGDIFGIGTSPYHLYHQGITADSGRRQRSHRLQGHGADGGQRNDGQADARHLGDPRHGRKPRDQRRTERSLATYLRVQGTAMQLSQMICGAVMT